MAGEITVSAEDARSADAAMLITRLCEEISATFGAPASPFNPADGTPPLGAFVIARVDGVAVGCGAFRKLDDFTAEVKRMYVSPEMRGRGIAQRVLLELERIAAANGYRTIRLETGDKLHAAIRLYENSGYRRIPAFGSYVGCAISVCFEKALG